jgi:hypothetical protein
MTAIRLTTKAVGLLDALGEKSRPQGFFAVMSPSELRMEQELRRDVVPA